MMDALEPIVTDEILEDCLQAVQRSADQGRAATVADVTAFAHIPAPTAEAALRELRSRGLLDSGSNGLALSDEGRRQAAAVIRRHRLSERLLTDVLAEACPPEELTRRLAETGITVQAMEPVTSTLEDVFTLLAKMGEAGAGG